MQNCREGHPKQIWKLDVGQPLRVRIDRHHRPDQCQKDQQDVRRGQIIVLEPELDGDKNKIKNKIERKRQRYYQRKLSCGGFVKDCAERDRDQNIQKCPHRTKNPARRRPRRLG